MAATRTWLSVIFLGIAAALPAADSLRVISLKCEYAVDPLGVDVAQPRLSWQAASEERGQRQTAWQVLAASTPGLLAQDRGDLWDSGRVASDETTFVGYRGAALKSSHQVFWKARAWDQHGKATAWSEPATWTMGLLAPDYWIGRWIKAPVESQSLLLRRDFSLGKPGLKRALLHVCGLGSYEVFLNGVKVGENLLAPGWTNFRKTALYDTYDVTALLRKDRNAIGLALGHGMYHVERPPGRFAKFLGSFGPLRAIAQLDFIHADGTQAAFTNADWRTQAGPITFSSIYGGEDYDARRLPAGWNQPGFDASAWTPAVETDDPLVVLRGQGHAAEPLRVSETRRPVSRRELVTGAVLYDFGQNTSFMPRIRVSGPAGAVVRMTPGEVVKADGTIERGTMGGAHRGSAWWQYTKATDGEETWFPQFYYVGSRYIHAELIPAKEGAVRPAIESVEMNIIHSSAEPLGHFATSNPLLNRIHDLVRWAQCSNFVSILTDCPHREKLGWIEQYHLNGPSIRYEFDAARIFAKGMNDMAEAQTAAGLVPNIAPEYTQFKGTFRAAAEWGAAFILVPWQQYQFTGDTDLMRRHYPAMQRYFAYLESRAENDILSEGLGDWYDYELGGGKRANLTPPPITATAFFYEDARTLGWMAGVLGFPADAQCYAAKAAQIRRSYIARFRREKDGLYGTASQASLAIPLVMGLIEPADHDRVVAALVRDVEQRGYATAGDVGFRYLLLALAGAGRSDVIYALINQDEKPGYGFQLKQGATALTESWHASLGASHNHFMLGQVMEWFYQDLAGIAVDPDAPGFKQILIRPQPVGDLAWVEAEYRSMHGPVAVRWERDAGRFVLKVTIPANATATIHVPVREGAAVTEGDQPAEKSPGVTPLRREGDRAIYRVDSGRYVFESAF